MRALKLMVPTGILAFGFILCVTTSFGKPEYAKKEKMKCVSCHSKMEAKDAITKNLTDTGKCYQAKEHSMTGCDNPEKK